jgi:hypothetical protein
LAYYYLVASLPRLILGERPPITSVELARMGDGQLSQPDLADLEHIVRGRPDEVAHPGFRAYVARETQLRDALARARAARVGAEAAAFERPFAGFDGEVERVAAEAMALSDPLERELMLDRFRFRILDGLALPSSFDAIVVLAYAAKLLLVERWYSFEEERGAALLHRLVDGSVAAVTV